MSHAEIWLLCLVAILCTTLCVMFYIAVKNP